MTLATTGTQIVQAFMESIAYDTRNTVALMKEESVTGLDLDPAGLTVRAADYGAFTRALPKVALREGVRVRQLLPSDESLESVFSYLVQGAA